MSRTLAERTGLLIIRATVDNHDRARFRARITRVVDGHELPVITTCGVEDACAIVRICLNELMEGQAPLSNARP